MIQYHLLLARKHSEPAGVSLLASFGDPHPLRLKYADLTGPAAATFAAEYSELLFVENGAVVAHHEYPNPLDVDARRQKQALSAARAALAERRNALVTLEQAKQRAALAASAVKGLTSEQQQLLAADEAARKATAATTQQVQAEREAQAAAAATQRQKTEAEAAAQRQKEAEAAQRQANLLFFQSRTDQQLAILAEARQIPIPEGATREQIVELLTGPATPPPPVPPVPPVPPAPPQS